MTDPFEQYSDDFEAPDQAVVDELRSKQQEDAENLVEAKKQEEIESAQVREEEAAAEPEQQRTRAQAKQEQEEKAAEPVKPEEPEDSRGYSGMDGLGRAVDTVKGLVAGGVEKTQTLRELSQAPAAGTVDYVADTLNMIPSVNIPKYRKFESDYAEASRELSSFIVPNLLLGAGGKALGAGLQGKVGWKIGQTKLAEVIGKAGVDTGVGVVVDYTNSRTEEGDNLQGTLKKMFPKTFSWISKDWATMDGDDPDVKRAKSINEGVGLGMFTSLLEASGLLLKGVLGTKKTTNYIAGSDSVETLIKELNEAASKGELPEDVFSNSVQSQEDALDQLGKYLLSKQIDLDQPIAGPKAPTPEAATPKARPIKDTRGQGKFYHGAAQEFELAPGGQYGGEQNIYGAGLYVTDDFQTASTYKPKNRPKGQKKAEAAEQGVVYDVDMSKQNLFDLEQSPTEELTNILRADRYDAMADLIDSSLAEAGPNASIREIMDEIRRGSRSFEVPAYEIQEVFLELQDELKKQGYTGWQHIGGLKAGKGKRQHQVAIIFDPDETASISKVNQEEFFEGAAPKQQAPSEPILGVHDTFTAAESGVRSVDPGDVLGAAVDAARIKNNIDTVYGRLGSVITEYARKEGLEVNNLTKRTVVKALVDKIKKGGKYSVELASGKRVTFEQIDAAGTELAEILINPRMDAGMLKATLDEFKDVVDDLGRKRKTVGKVGYNAVVKTLKKYLDDYANMDVNKAAAYLVHSEAGQISDLAEGARYMEGTEAVGRAQEMILDRIEYWMVEKGLAAYNWGASLNFLNTTKRFSNNPEILLKAGQNAAEQSEEALKNIVNRAKSSANSLRYMAKERPDFLVPLQMAWEASDGNVDTLAKLHNFVNQSLGNIEKAFIDLQPEIPNQIVQGFWSNIYNSVLSAFSTPIKAFAGNAVLLVQKPISVFAGAAASGDMQTLKRASYQYLAITDTFGKALKHMGSVYSKAARDPSSVSYIMRDDLAAKNEATMDVLHSFARAAEKNGEDGPLVLYEMANTMQDIANNPWLRFGANAMTALDGFTRAALANIEARGRVYDKMIKNSFGPQLSAADLIKAENEIYDGMFDKSGMITDKAVDYASREIALNLDTDNVKILSNLIARAPFLKPFLMFPRTADNMVGMVNKFSPVSVFIKDYNKLALPGMNFTGQQMKEILDARNIYYSNGDEMLIAFKNLRAEIRGRKAIGTASILGAAFMFTQDRLTGNGHFDKERQRNRKQLGWKPRSYKGWDGKWYSYEGLGPMADFIAVTADIMDNSDTIDEPSFTTLMNKAGFILGANLTNKSFLAGLEPMNDVLSGNPAAMARWGASFGSSLIPLSGFRNELGRLMQPELRELDQELFQLFKNRNRFLDVFDESSALPTAYDWIDGTPVGYTEGFFTRMWNTYMPMKVSDGLSSERQFLVDIEYDARPTFNKSSRGIEYTPEERSELFSLMGKNQSFKKAIQRIMRSHEAEEWRKQIKAHRANGHKIDEKVYANLYYQLDRELRFAKAEAERDLSNYDEINTITSQEAVNVIDQRQSKAPSFPLTNR